MKNWTTYTIILSLLVEFSLAQQWMNLTSQQHTGKLPTFNVGTASYLAPDMFILGANTGSLEEIWMLNMTGGYIWTPVESSVLHNYQMSQTWDSVNNRVVFYGLYTGSDTFFMDDDFLIGLWVNPSYNPAPPRIQVPLAMIGNYLFTYQGQLQFPYPGTPDLWSWEMSSPQDPDADWYPWAASDGNSSTGIFDSDMIAYNGDLYEFGGAQATVQSTCVGTLYRLTLNYTSHSYTRQAIASIPGRRTAKLVMAGTKLYVLGGYCPGSISTWETWVIDLAEISQATPLSFVSIQSINAPPTACIKSPAAMYANEQAGIMVLCPDTTLFKLDLSAQAILPQTSSVGTISSQIAIATTTSTSPIVSTTSNSGAIIAAGCGVAGFLGCMAALVFFIRRRRQQQAKKKADLEAAASTAKAQEEAKPRTYTKEDLTKLLLEGPGPRDPKRISRSPETMVDVFVSAVTHSGMVAGRIALKNGTV